MEQMSDRSDHFEQYLVSIAFASHKVCTLLTRVQSRVKHLFPRACVSACEHPPADARDVPGMHPPVGRRLHTPGKARPPPPTPWMWAAQQTECKRS